MTALARLRHWRSDTRGVSAVEFALVAPILFLFYFASIEISLMLSVDRKVTNVASAVGDLVAQDDLVDADEMEAVFAAAGAIMNAANAEALELRVTNVAMDMDGDIGVTWSYARGFSPLACGSVVAIPDGLLTPGQSVVLAEARLDYTPPIGDIVTGPVVLRDEFYLRPRRSAEVVFNPDPCP